MKSIVNRLALSAASLLTASVLLTTGVSAMYGQEQLTAHVPFSFKAGQAMLEAGDYTVAPNYHATNGIILLRNAETGKSVLMPVQTRIYQSKDTRPRMIFHCASGECAISQIFNDSDGWQFAAPKLSPAEKERLAVVYFNNHSSSNN